MLQFLLPFLAAAGGAAAATAGSRAANTGIDKINGVPTPNTPGGSESGQFASDYMDKAYPGTTPWERLGSGGSPSSAMEMGQNIKSQQLMQDREFAQQRRITEMNNRASVIGASSPFGAMAQESSLSRYMAGTGGTYDTSIAQNREKLPYEKRSIREGSRKSEAETKILDAKGKLAPEQAEADLISQKYGNYGKTAISLRQDIDDFIRNRSKRPRRFQ